MKNLHNTSKLPQNLPFFAKLARGLSQTFIQLTQRCVLCDDYSQDRICKLCTSYFTKARHSCQTCGIPLKHHAISCGECLKNPPYYDHTYAPYLYQAPLTRLISDFKHNGNLFAGKALSELFYEEIRNYYQQHHLELPTLVAPVPLHWRRQWKRGFNQAVVLSDDIVKNMKLTLVTQSRRTKATSAQKMLSRKERLKNLKDCFHIKASLSGKSVAIIDDVMTTGTTVNLFAQALKKAGAGQVTVWVLTRTPSENI